MIARLILELLAILPGLAEDITKTVQEMHTEDSTGTKAKAAASSVAKISAALATVVGVAADTQDGAKP